MISTEVYSRNEDFILTILDEAMAIGSIHINRNQTELIPLLQNLFLEYNVRCSERDNPSAATVTGRND